MGCTLSPTNVLTQQPARRPQPLGEALSHAPGLSPPGAVPCPRTPPGLVPLVVFRCTFWFGGNLCVCVFFEGGIMFCFFLFCFVFYILVFIPEHILYFFVCFLRLVCK